MIRLLLSVSLPHLRVNLARTALVIGGTATGVSLILAINIINHSVLASFSKTIADIAGPADLQVTLGVGEIGFSEDVLDIVRDDPGVEMALPLVRGTVSLAEDPGDVLQLFGTDILAEKHFSRYQIELVSDEEDAAAVLTDPRSVFITQRLAKEKGLSIGDVIRLSTPQGTIDFTVRGLLATRGLAAAFAGRLVVTDFFAAQWILGKQGHIDQIDIVVSQDANVDTVRAHLERILPNVLKVLLPEQHGMQYRGVLGSFQAMLGAISSLCLIAGLFIIYNTTSTAAIRRSRVMARLRLIGAKRSVLFRLMVVESAILGLVGALVGVLVGVPLAWILSGTIADSMGVIFQLRFPIEQLVVG